MAKTATKKDQTVAEKLDSLYSLQNIDSEIDRIKTLRGELPLEVQDLEDEVEGLDNRVVKMQEELKALETEVSDRKNSSKDAEASIAKYKEQQNNVRNNREYDSISKEVEYQELEIQLNEKKNKELKFRISSKKEILEAAEDKRKLRGEDLESKKSELDAIIAETQAQEDKLVYAVNVAAITYNIHYEISTEN